MKKSRFTEEQVTYALRQTEGGTAAPRCLSELSHFVGNLLYLEEKCGELSASEVRRLRQLEDENARLKRLVADLTLDKNILQEVIKKDLRPVRRRELAVWIRKTYGLAIDKACNLAKLSPSCRYKLKKNE